MMLKHISVRIDEELLEKLHVVAEYEGRSINKHILVMMEKVVGNHCHHITTNLVMAN